LEIPLLQQKEYINLVGKVKWFKLTPSKFDDWNHMLYLDEPSIELFRKLQAPSLGVSGIQNKLQKDEDGYYATIRRPTFKKVGQRIFGFDPPMVFDKDGVTPWDLSEKPVGNGSEVEDKCEYYTFNFQGKRGTAIRWDKTRIIDLVPFEKLPDNEGNPVKRDREVIQILSNRITSRDKEPF
jgi:hypothetical protein